MKTPFKEESHLEKNISKMKICFWKSEKELILFSKKIKTPFQPLCKENCYSSWSVTKPFIFWKVQQLLRKDPTLKMKALSKNFLKMKTPFKKGSHFENESSFKKHFEKENMFLEKIENTLLTTVQRKLLLFLVSQVT